MQVTVIGAGYVGLATGVMLAFLGHRVQVVDHNPEIVAALQKGRRTIYEYGLENMLQQAADNLTFTSTLGDVGVAEVVMIAVGTPSREDGATDLGFVEKALLEVAGHCQGPPYPLIINKSTVPPGTACWAQTLVNGSLTGRGFVPGVAVVSNPEFLREGSALFDALYPDRIVLGAREESSFATLRELYQPLLSQQFTPPAYLPRPQDYTGPALVQTDPVTTELIKYASNAFLSVKISFINEFAALAELLGADIAQIARGMGLDQRIGEKFLRAGLGWGGSCFGKDTSAITQVAKKYDSRLSIVEAAIGVNHKQKKIAVTKLQAALGTIPGSIVGILGLAFKPDTDDVRDTPATAVIRELQDLGAFIKVYDPMAMDNYRKQHAGLKVVYCASLEELAAGCDALILMTEWEQFKKADWQKIGQRMQRKIIVDGRNLLDPKEMQSLGFDYRGVGRRTAILSCSVAVTGGGP